MMRATLKLANMTGNTEVVDTAERWGIVVLEMPALFGASVKDVPTREWPDEHGVDVYDSNESYLGAFDVDIKLGIYTEFDEDDNMITDINASIKDFIQWFTSGGILKKIYSPHTRHGRQNVRFKSLVPESVINKNGQYVMEMKLTVEIGDPITPVTL